MLFFFGSAMALYRYVGLPMKCCRICKRQALTKHNHRLCVKNAVGGSPVVKLEAECFVHFDIVSCWTDWEAIFL